MAKTAGANSWGHIRKLPSKRFQASYVGPDMRRHNAPETFSTKLAAQGWLAAERKLVESEGWVSPAVREQVRMVVAAPVTVGEYALGWLDRATHLRATTRAQYERHVRLRIVPGLGDVPLRELDRARVVAWWNGLDHSNERTCDLTYSLLRTVLFGAVDDGLVESNPAQRVRGAGKPSKRRTVDPLTPEQVAAVADGMPERWRLGVLLGAWCGLRSGEVRELRRKDIDVVRGLVKVRRAVTRASGVTLIGEPKTEAGVRDVPIPSAMLGDVRRHLLDYTQLGDEGLLFYDLSTGGSVHDSTWRRSWLKACERAGVTDFHFHDLRKTGLTYLALSGATVRELQVIAGHTTATMAMRYQEVARDHLTRVYDRLSRTIEVTGTP
ncbi:MAG: site-specific integrase [Propionibacteriaceae bacterium]|jgi:integrase|nr:site-specific integrase [Propionibacteriaceae bacterium]